MPKPKVKLKKLRYKTRLEAINDHEKNYRTAGGLKDKFNRDGPDRYRIRKIIEAIPDFSRVLDIGCNDGTLGWCILREKQGTVFGLDVVSKLVDAAQAKGVLARVGSAEEIPFKDNKFDVVVMAEVMEHLYDPGDALDEIARVIKPEGIFLGSVPHPDGTLGRDHPTGGDYHQTVFETEDLTDLLLEYFENVDVTPTPYSKDYCLGTDINQKIPQWNNWKCWGVT